jgi:hypothetical protein
MQTIDDMTAAIEPEIAKIADRGKQGWRRSTRIDIALLATLPCVCQTLEIAEQQGAGLGPDPQRDAIEEAIQASIMHLPNPFQAAILAQFGFDDGSGKKVHRELRAAEALGKGDRWFRKPSSEYFGLTPYEYCVAFVTSALCGASDPQGDIARRHEAAPTPVAAISVDRQGVQTFDVTSYNVWALAAIAFLTVGLLVWAILEQGRSGTPARGSVVDATTGTILPANALLGIRPTPGPAVDGFGEEIFTVCDTTATKGCPVFVAGPIHARQGDTLLIRITLHDGGRLPISELRISMAQIPLLRLRGHYGTDLRFMLQYPGGKHTEEMPSGDTQGEITVYYTDTNTHELRYISGSTRLYDPSGEWRSEGRLLAHMPDGIDSVAGITLLDVGPPKGCWRCDVTYMRYVDFSMRAE